MDDFKRRLISALIFGPVVISCFYFLPPFPFFLFILLIGFVALREGLKVSEPKVKCLLLPYSLFSFVFLYFKRYENFMLWLLFFAVLCVAVTIFIPGKTGLEPPQEVLKTVIINVMATLFIVLPLYYVYALKELEIIYPLVLLLTIWGSDVSAYFIGNRFGKHKLCPVISPGKTFEGLLGALLGSTAVFLGFNWVLRLDMANAIFMGVLMGFLGQTGDIFESSFKRYFGIKDSSKIIPGHGGILDRIDSFIFTAPFFYKILSF